jgi:hypothetical protein
MRLRVEKQIVLDKLARELKAAGVPLARAVCSIPNGLYIPLTDESQEPEYSDLIIAIIAAHDGIDDVKQRLDNIPGWATWTEAEALEWFATYIDNLTIPADVKKLLKAYGRMLLVLRDKVYKE